MPHPRTLLAAAFLALLSVSCDLRGGASDDDIPLVGLLRVIPDDHQPAFVDELRAQGWSGGRDVEVVPRGPDEVASDPDQARRLLREWARADVDLIVASSTPYAALAAELVPDVPTLFLVVDPVAAGLVRDPARPDSNMTGLTFWTPADRTLDLASQVLGGGLDRVGYLAPVGDPAVEGHLAGVLAASEELGIDLVEVVFDGPEAVPAAVDELSAAGVDLVYLPSANATVQALDVLETALMAARLPVVANADYVDFALLVLAPDGEEVRRQLARQAARLLAGADVSSVPVENPRRFVTTVDRGVADTLGLPPIDPAVLRKMDVVR